MKSKRTSMAVSAAAALVACTGGSPAATRKAAINPTSPPVQASGGRPYALLGTQVWDVPDPSSHRVYQVFVSVPLDYDQHPDRRYPVLYVTDADYAFPVVRQIARRLNGDGPRIRDFILVGLSYAKGEDGMTSRRRDYTPTAGGTTDAPPGAVYGQGPAYQIYLAKQVIPFIAAHYRTEEASRYFLGHSYGGLLGAQILLSDPGLFRGYILGSPSLWYDHHAIFRPSGAMPGPTTTFQQPSIFMSASTNRSVRVILAMLGTRTTWSSMSRRLLRPYEITITPLCNSMRKSSTTKTTFPSHHAEPQRV